MNPINPFPLEYSTPDDKYYDYCLWEYAPVAPPEGKLRPSNLLIHSFELTGIGGKGAAITKALRSAIGLFNTVWGIKNIGGELAWEYYFYDYRRRNRQRSVTLLQRALQPFGACGPSVNENLNYFMFSLDFTKSFISGAASMNEIHLYIGNPGSAVSSGICYSVTEERTKLENFYFFFKAHEHMDDIAGKISSSAFLDATALSIDSILWPEMVDCGVIVIANKQANDAVYFSRVTVSQLLYFLKRLVYPPPLIEFIEYHREKLDHLLFDVGFDYRMEAGKMIILKSGYYGTF
jgi:hypothetical protein